MSTQSRMSTYIVLCAVLCCLAAPVRADEPPSREAAEAALKKAVRFFREEVSIRGGYLWRYAFDLDKREGETRAGKFTAWVQPPGTPTVGMAYLDAYRRLGDADLLEAARETAHALVQGQLLSGGWDYRIEFDPQNRQRYAYRVDPPDGQPGKRHNTTTLDDNTTQAALQFLMQVDQTLQFQDARIHTATQYALEKLLAAQYPNGGWPQQFDAPPDPAQFPVGRANYPAEWPRAWPNQDYRSYYTFNDNALADAIELMFDAAEIYRDERFRAAARRGGDFILLAQLPDPQPAWAQQYNVRMQPAWARKFEPPSVTGGESQGILAILMDVYHRTGDAKYLEPIPRALEYLKKSQLPEGGLARFYELQTNRPLYFTKKYELTYEDDDLPTHYAFKVGSKMEGLEKQYRDLLKNGLPAKPNAAKKYGKPQLGSSLIKQAQEAIAGLDERGAWVESGRLTQEDADEVKEVVETRTFVKNLDALARYLQASRP